MTNSSLTEEQKKLVIDRFKHYGAKALQTIEELEIKLNQKEKLAYERLKSTSRDEWRMSDINFVLNAKYRHIAK
jgi:hypothetical protein